VCVVLCLCVGSRRRVGAAHTHTSMLQCVAVYIEFVFLCVCADSRRCTGAHKCVAVCCSVLQFVAVCCSVYRMCVAVCMRRF